MSNFRSPHRRMRCGERLYLRELRSLGSRVPVSLEPVLRTVPPGSYSSQGCPCGCWLRQSIRLVRVRYPWEPHGWGPRGWGQGNGPLPRGQAQTARKGGTRGNSLRLGVQLFRAQAFAVAMPVPATDCLRGWLTASWAPPVSPRPPRPGCTCIRTAFGSPFPLHHPGTHVESVQWQLPSKAVLVSMACLYHLVFP